MKASHFLFAFLILGAVVSDAVAQFAPVISWNSAPRQVVRIGRSLILAVEATGAPAPAYQWMRNGRPVPGATSKFHRIEEASPLKDNGWYQVVVSNSSGSVTSAPMFVNVDVYPARILTSGNYGATTAPVPEGLNHVVAVAAGAGHWVALKADGTVTAWGYNAYGQTTVPADLNDVVAIAACNYTSFALRSNGTVVAWGDGTWGQKSPPAGLTNVVGIAAGQSHALALKADGTVVGWGWNLDGQASPPSGLTGVVSIAAGENNSFAIKADGTAVGWGNTFAGNPNVLAGLTGLVDVASGEDFSIALTTERRIIGWAPGYSGTGIPLDDLTDIVSIAAGLWHALALKADGSVVSWGQTYTGPAEVPENATDIVAIDAKDAYSIALRHSLKDVIVAGPAYTFTTLAGQAGTYSQSSIDGTGTSARFGNAAGIAVDVARNVYVADFRSSTIRKVTPAGVVTTLAGQPGVKGFADGQGASATFYSPWDLAVGGGSIHVADVTGVIRKVSTAGVVTTLAGVPGIYGYADGTGSNARFEAPAAIAADRFGNAYVADSAFSYLTDDPNCVIRKITPDGVVSTVAGTAREYGSVDGTGAAARFSYASSGIAVDSSDHVIVADTLNQTIRKITPDGTVTTLAGSAGSTGVEDGTGSAARFDRPSDVAVDRHGNVFVADSGNRAIRRITPDGQVTHVMNEAGGVASYLTHHIAVDDAGNLYIIADNALLKGVPVVPAAPATITSRLPRSLTVPYGRTAVLSVQTEGPSSPTYQWTKDGVILPGATSATLIISGVTSAHTGEYACLVTNSFGTVTSDGVMLSTSSTTNVGRLINLSTRAPAGTGTRALNLGYVLYGPPLSDGAPMLLRAAGPSLAPYDVPGLLPDPNLDLYASGGKIDENDDWGGDSGIAATSSRVGAFPFIEDASTDAALYMPSCYPGLYTMVVSGTGSATGVVLAEIYDATSTGSFSADDPHLINASARAHAGTGDDVLIVGFVIDGETSMTLLVRAIGPSLVLHGVTNRLADPKLQLFSGSTKILENDYWSEDSGVTPAVLAQAGAFNIPLESKDAALFVTLPPGAYTAHVSGADGGTGVALVEIFVVR